MARRAKETATGATSSTRPRGVRALVVSAAVSSVGDGAFVAAAPLLAASLTRDPVAVSVVAAASAAPWVLVGPWAGAWVDRLPRRAVMITADAVRALGLALLGVLVLLDRADIVALAAAAFLVTAGRSFFDAASQAIVPQIVGRSGTALAHTNGRMAAADTAGRNLAGPPLGGALFGVAPWAPFVIDSASFAISGAALARVPARDAPSSDGQPLWRAVRQGFAYLLHDRTLVLLAAAMCLYNLGYNLAFGVFVLYAQDVLALRNLGFGLLLTAASAGAMLMGWRARDVVSKIGVHGSVLASSVAQASSWALLAAFPSRIVGVAALSLLGAASTLITVAVVTARQQQVADHLLGRVVTAFRLFGNGAAPVGAALGGLLASAFGLAAPLWVGACVSLSILLLLLLGVGRARTS
jgi:predicted MFS family arabinose efflux permease